MTQATHNAIAEIAQVVERVTRTLSGRNIQVEQRGLQVGVEYDAKGVPKKVFLPSISDNPKPELITAIQGFLDKEVSRLLFTDHEYLYKNKVGKFKKGMAGSIQDILEDIRTENLMTKEFRGSGANFSKNHDFAIKEIIAPTHASERDPKKKMANLAMPGLRAAAGSLPYEEFMAKKWPDLGPLGGAILHYAEEIRAMETTQDSFVLTNKIIAKMQESSSDGDDDEGEEGEKKKSKGEGKGSDKSKSDGKSDKREKSDDDGTDGDDEGQGDDEESGEEESQGEGEGKGGSADRGRSNKKVENLSEVNKDMSQKKGKLKPSGSSGTQQGLSSFEKIDDAFEEADWNASVQKKIKQIAREDHKGQYVPYSREFDYVGPFVDEQKAIAKFGSTTTGTNIYKAAHEKSHVIQQQVQRLFVARSLVRHEPGHRRGKINPAALHRLPFGDEKIFRRKVETNSKDVAVSLLIDMSGSMSGTKIQYACIAALMFSNVLSNLGIAHEVSAFSTYSGYSSVKMPAMEGVNKMLHGRSYDPDDTTSYSRYAPITNYIAKAFDKRATEETRKLISMIPEAYHYSMANNVDGESVEVVGLRLLRRKEKKKVMIVMSDGSPAADGHGGMLCDHLVKVVKRLSDAGIEMLGLGLMDTSVKRFYPKHQIVSKIEEIPDKILELTRQMVVGV